MEHSRLPREVFMALAAVGWADGALDSEEADAIARAAVEEGLPLAEVEAIEKGVRAPVQLADVDVSQLSATDRLYAYATALWIASLNGEVNERERNTIAVLGYTLRLTPKGRTAMDEAVKELLARPEAHRPSRFDLTALKSAIRERVEGAARARVAKADDTP